MALFKESFNYQELIDCAKGKLAGVDFPKLPLPPMLMFDEVTSIRETGGAYNKGTAHAQFRDGCTMATIRFFSWKYGGKR